MRNITASSAELPPASNLQCDMVVLSSERAGRKYCDDGEIRPQVKNEWTADNAAEVIGGVDIGERIRARNGDSIEVNGIS